MQCKDNSFLFGALNRSIIFNNTASTGDHNSCIPIAFLGFSTLLSYSSLDEDNPFSNSSSTCGFYLLSVLTESRHDLYFIF